MYPRPPQLFKGKGVTDDEPGESYWKIFNGFRLTGMPGFSKALNETQMWQLALLVANADKLPPSAKAALAAPSATAGAAATMPASDQSLLHNRRDERVKNGLSLTSTLCGIIV